MPSIRPLDTEDYKTLGPVIAGLLVAILAIVLFGYPALIVLGLIGTFAVLGLLVMISFG